MKLRIIPLEERIVLDAAIGAVVTDALISDHAFDDSHDLALGNAYTDSMRAIGTKPIFAGKQAVFSSPDSNDPDEVVYHGSAAALLDPKPTNSTMERVGWASEPGQNTTVTVFIDAATMLPPMPPSARLAMATLNSLNTGVTLKEVTSKNSANIWIHNAPSSGLGSISDSLLGSTEYHYTSTGSRTSDGGRYYRFTGQTSLTMIKGNPWYAGASKSVPKGYWDYQTIMEHELGHAVGLDHDTHLYGILNSDGRDVMNPVQISGMTHRNFSSADIADIIQLYGTRQAQSSSSSSSTSNPSTNASDHGILAGWPSRPGKSMSVDVYIDQSSGGISANEAVSIRSAMTYLNSLNTGVYLLEANRSSKAEIVFQNSTTSSNGGVDKGVLASTDYSYKITSRTFSNGDLYYRFRGTTDITMISGNSWYTGDSANVPSASYDYQTVALRELAKALGTLDGSIFSGSKSGSSSTTTTTTTVPVGVAQRTLNSTEVSELARIYGGTTTAALTHGNTSTMLAASNLQVDAADPILSPERPAFLNSVYDRNALVSGSNAKTYSQDSVFSSLAPSFFNLAGLLDDNIAVA